MSKASHTDKFDLDGSDPTEASTNLNWILSFAAAVTLCMLLAYLKPELLNMAWLSSPAVHRVVNEPVRHFPLSAISIPVTLHLNDNISVEGSSVVHASSMTFGCSFTLSVHQATSDCSVNSDGIKIYALWAVKSAYCCNAVALAQLLHLVENHQHSLVDLDLTEKPVDPGSLRDACRACNLLSTLSVNAGQHHVDAVPPPFIKDIPEFRTAAHSRNVFPLLILCRLPYDDAAVSQQFKALVAVVHLPDAVCTMRAQILHQFLIQANNVVHHLKPFYDSSAVGPEQPDRSSLNSAMNEGSARQPLLEHAESTATSADEPGAGKLCIVCYDKKPCMLMPCRHVAICVGCFDEMHARKGGPRSCCVCRGYVTGVAAIK